MNIVRSTSSIFFGRILTVVLGLLGLTVFTSIVPSSHLGTFFLFQSLLGVLSIPADFGIRTAITKRVSEGTKQDIYFTSGLLIKTSLLAVLSVGIILFRAPINQYVGGDVALLLVVAIWLQELGGYMMATLKGELRVGETAVWQLLKPVGWVGIGGLLVYLGTVSSKIALIVGLVVGMGLLTIVGIARLSVRVRRPSVPYLRSVVEFSSFAALGSVGGLVYNWADILILGVFVSKPRVAAYEVAWQVAMNATMISVAIRTVMFPQASEWYENDRLDKIEDVLPDLIVISLMAAIPAVVGGVLLREEILTYVFSPEYAVASIALAILLVNMLDSSVAQVLGGGILYALDRPDLSLRATTVSLVLNIALNLLLIPVFGLLGAAIATTAASGVGTTINIWYVSQYLTLRFNWYRIGWVVVASLIMGGVVYAIITVRGVPGPAALAVIVCLGVVVYGSVILSRSYYRELLRRIIAEVV